ncbi:MAG: hypothetical protein DMF84_06185 [Acidobacteria bacterium]|nr:MAG: hypothetical protein DMF84_06185 [Acidobacteriota bacterium]
MNGVTECAVYCGEAFLLEGGGRATRTTVADLQPRESRDLIPSVEKSNALNRSLHQLTSKPRDIASQ